LKRERWGSPLVHEKYREEKAYDRRNTYHIIIIIIIIMKINLNFSLPYIIQGINLLEVD